MFYYVVKTIGDGTEENSFRPNVPEGVSYVCNYVGNSYLVGTITALNETEITDLQTFCSSNNLIYEDISKWSVGDTF